MIDKEALDKCFSVIILDLVSGNGFIIGNNMYIRVTSERQDYIIITREMVNRRVPCHE